MSRSSWVDTHPWLSTGGALLCCIAFALRGALPSPQQSDELLYDWTWAAMSFLAFLRLALNVRSDFFSKRDA